MNERELERILQLPVEVIIRIFEILPVRFITPFSLIDKTKHVAYNRMFSDIDVVREKRDLQGINDLNISMTVDEIVYAIENFPAYFNPKTLHINTSDIGIIHDLLDRVRPIVTKVPSVDISLVCDSLEDGHDLSCIQEFQHITSIKLINGTSDLLFKLGPLVGLRKLKLINCGLTGFDCSDIVGLSSLTLLDLSCNFIDPNWLLNLPETLQTLVITDIELDSELVLPSNLHTLLLPGNNISDLGVLGLNRMFEVKRIDLSNCRIKTVSSDLCSILPPNLELLDLSNNLFSVFDVKRFPIKLVRLDIRYNPIGFLKDIEFPSTIRELAMDGYVGGESYSTIDINSMTFPIDIVRLGIENMARCHVNNYTFPPKLKYLALAACGLTNIHDLILPNGLEELYLSENRLHTIKDYRFPSSLKDVYLENNHLSTVENVSFDCDFEGTSTSSLENLFINNNNLKCIRGFHLPDSLTTLQCDSNELVSIREVKFPSSLIHLRLERNKITSLRNINWPQKLRSATFFLNEISEFMEPGDSLPENLEHLQCQMNLITTIHKDFRFPKLAFLSLFQNPISNLSEITFPDTLRSINLGFNPIKDLKSINLPSNLTRLSILGSEITSLDGVVFPPSLQNLYLGMNSIRSVGSNVSCLSNLTKLILTNCEITRLADLQLPASVTHLDVSYNHIKRLEIGPLPGTLREFNVKRNPIEPENLLQFLEETKIRAIKVIGP